jgi:hypothetical protein
MKTALFSLASTSTGRYNTWIWKDFAAGALRATDSHSVEPSFLQSRSRAVHTPHKQDLLSNARLEHNLANICEPFLTEQGRRPMFGWFQLLSFWSLQPNHAKFRTSLRFSRIESIARCRQSMIKTEYSTTNNLWTISGRDAGRLSRTTLKKSLTSIWSSRDIKYETRFLTCWTKETQHYCRLDLML